MSREFETRKSKLENRSRFRFSIFDFRFLIFEFRFSSFDTMPFELTPIKLIYGGEALGHHAGRTVLVPRVLPGERAGWRKFGPPKEWSMLDLCGFCKLPRSE